MREMGWVPNSWHLRDAYFGVTYRGGTIPAVLGGFIDSGVISDGTVDPVGLEAYGADRRMALASPSAEPEVRLAVKVYNYAPSTAFVAVDGASTRIPSTAEVKLSAEPGQEICVYVLLGVCRPLDASDDKSAHGASTNPTRIV